MYGGNANAMKAAGHELKGLMSYYNCRIKKKKDTIITFDYSRRSALTCSSDGNYRLPRVPFVGCFGASHRKVNNLLRYNNHLLCRQLIYGSRDAGKTVYATNTQMNQLMRSAAVKMNLKAHIVGKQHTTLHSCGDIEGHLGKDDRLYLLDFARVFPPQVNNTLKSRLVTNI